MTEPGRSMTVPSPPVNHGAPARPMPFDEWFQAITRDWEHMPTLVMEAILDSCFKVPRVADMSDGYLRTLGLHREDGWI